MLKAIAYIWGNLNYQTLEQWAKHRIHSLALNNLKMKLHLLLQFFLVLA
jgi:hypothetical protein